MKRKDLQNLRQKKVEELKKEAEQLKVSIAKARMDASMGSLKDTNAIRKEGKKLAVILTIISEQT